MISARLLEERRRKRDRRDARECAYREWVCGGPLVDALLPVIGGGTDAEHEARLHAEFAERQRRVGVELDLLARDFARRCALSRLAQVLMVSDWLDLNASLTRRLGPPGPQATHSTSSTTARRHTPFGTIPAL